MSLFASPQVVLWPHQTTLDLYTKRPTDNLISFDLNLWEKINDNDLAPLSEYLHRRRISRVSILASDDVIVTRSFVYDSKIDAIDQPSVLNLIGNSVAFKIDLLSLDYQLIPRGDKTIIRTTITDRNKLSILEDNLRRLSLKITQIQSLSTAVARLMTRYCHSAYFFLLPKDGYKDYSLFLVKDNLVYLSVAFKGSSLDIQKTLNYSHLYFGDRVNKLFIPHAPEVEIISTTVLEKTKYDPAQIAADYHLPSNLPLPLIGLFSHPVIIKPAPVISSTPPLMNENKKNILPLVAVFIFTAAIASIIIWFVLNRNQPATVPLVLLPTQAPAQSTPTPAITVTPDFKSKIQVLNATDINGLAAAFKSQLVALGFSSVTPGNSKELAATNQVSFKASLGDISAFFNSKLGSRFEASYSADLQETAAYDIIFTLGTDIRTTPTTPPSGP